MSLRAKHRKSEGHLNFNCKMSEGNKKKVQRKNTTQVISFEVARRLFWGVIQIHILLCYDSL